MIEYTSYEIQDISSNFRNIARRLSKTDYSQCDSNLKRFIIFLYTEPLISDFLKKYNTTTYDIAKIISERELNEPFDVSPNMSEEVSLSYQLLKYSVDYFDGDFTRLYGTQWYTKVKSTVNDEMKTFIEHIIDPLIDHINEYLRQCYNEAYRKEGRYNSIQTPNINSTNSIINIGNNVGGSINSQSTVSTEAYKDALEIINSLDKEVDNSDIETKEEIKELLEQIKIELKNGKMPQKGFLTAIKTLCSNIPELLAMVKALIALFPFK